MIEAVKHGKERAESSLLNGLSGLWSKERVAEEGCTAGGAWGSLGNEQWLFASCETVDCGVLDGDQCWRLRNAGTGKHCKPQLQLRSRRLALLLALCICHPVSYRSFLRSVSLVHHRNWKYHYPDRTIFLQSPESQWIIWHHRPWWIISDHMPWKTHIP